MAREYITAPETCWVAAQRVLNDTKSDVPHLDVGRIISTACELISAYECDDRRLFADTLKRIVCHGYDASPKPKDWQGG